MSDTERYEDLSETEQLSLRQSPEWQGPFRESAAKAEAALLVHRLSGALNRVSNKEDDPEFPPFTGMAASVLCAPPAVDSQSHGTNGDLAATESIGTQGLRGLNVAARSSIVSASDNDALTEWQKSRHRILQRPAPWTAITAPGIGLLKDIDHPFAPEGSGERLLPHSTAFSQTLFLAIHHRMGAMQNFVEKEHPEWLDENGEISPFSVLRYDGELSAYETLERERVITELAFIRDLKEQGILYLEHAKPGDNFFDFQGVGEKYAFVPKNGYEWSRATENQALRWQRVQGQSPNLTFSAGKYDSKNSTSKAQVLCLMSAYAGFPMEEGVYQDRSNGKKEHRTALFLNTRWASQERLMLIEQMISHYQATGLTADTQAYRGALMAQGLSEDDSYAKAALHFESPVIEGIEQTMAVLEMLAEHHTKQPSIDIGDAYISLLDTSATDPRTPVLSSLGLQRFGLSVDPSKINEQIVTDMGSTLAANKRWTLNRGYQPRTFEVISRVVAEQGYLGLNVHSDALFQKGATAYSKEKETEYMLKHLQNGSGATQESEARLAQSLEEANARIESFRTSLIEMRERLNRSVSRNEDLEHALAVSEDLYVATNISALEMMAEQENIKLPPISEQSKAALWMEKKGFDVPDHHRFINGKSVESSSQTPITLKQAFELTDQVENTNRQAMIDYFGDFDHRDSAQSSSPSFI
jgi:hypothetical protein